MKVVVFGATGMVGQGVLRECLLDSGVERVLTVGRIDPGMTFVYVSGAGTDSTERGRAMLAVARRGARKPVLENDEIDALGE